MDHIDPHEANTRDLLAIIGADTNLKHAGHNWWSGPCPWCNGTDRFVVKLLPNGEWRWYCRVCGDGKYHDVIDYVAKREQVKFPEAYERITGNKLQGLSPETIAERQRIQAQEQAERIRKLDELTREFTSHELWQVFCNRMNDEHRAWWRDQGITDDWQKFWRLGYTEDRAFNFQDTLYHSPAYTIPKFDYEWTPKNIDYRLLTFPEGAGKYRPEANLPPAPFISRPDVSQPAELMVIVEGSKKAMVTTLYSGMPLDRVHVYGIPSKNSWAGVEERAKNCDRVYIALDPDATDWAYKLAATIGKTARVVEMPFKPDDGFLQFGLDAKGWREFIKYARIPKGVQEK